VTSALLILSIQAPGFTDRVSDPLGAKVAPECHFHFPLPLCGWVEPKLDKDLRGFLPVLDLPRLLKLLDFKKADLSVLTLELDWSPFPDMGLSGPRCMPETLQLTALPDPFNTPKGTFVLFFFLELVVVLNVICGSFRGTAKIKLRFLLFQGRRTTLEESGRLGRAGRQKAQNRAHFPPVLHGRVSVSERCPATR